MYSKHHGRKRSLFQDERDGGRRKHHKHAKGICHGDRAREGHGQGAKGGWFQMNRRSHAPVMQYEKDQGTKAAGLNTCPLCKNHCPLDEPGCPKGEAFVLSLHSRNAEDRM